MKHKLKCEKTLKCEVCGKPAVGVCSSQFGAISCAFCAECLHAGREPYNNLVGGLSGVESLENLAEWAREAIKPTLEYYHKTVEDLFDDIKKNDDEFDTYMQREASIYQEFPT